jgi:hypothetical protein
MPRNRPITRGDRLWTDEGARAEVSFGSSVLHMDGRTFVEVVAIDEDVVQLRVNEGMVNAHVREVRGGDNFEIDTPQLALRVTEPGDWRMDVDPQRGFTRVAVHSGMATVYGAGGGVQQVAAGQQVAFAGTDLAHLANVPQVANGDFERWAMDRNRTEDQSIAARFIPRDVVGYQELDQNGTWSQDPNYGTVWYPTDVAPDWAPYRYGRWDWVAPWGWTWVDDAPWGFAPFHYGRWTTIGTRWAWVPGPLGRRPVYAPALVAFVGGNDVSFSFSSGPGIGWYPLAPGEIWQPFYNASPVYVRNVNRYVVTSSRFYNTGPHRFLQRPDAITSVRVDDFNRGRHIAGRGARVNVGDVARVQAFAPPMPSREFRREQREQHARNVAPPPQRWSPPAAMNSAPQPQQRALFQPPVERRDFTQRAQQQMQRQADANAQQWRVQREQQVREQQQVQRQQQQQAIQAQQRQRIEAARQQQQAVREAQRQQVWQAQQHQQQQQRAWAQQQQQQFHQQQRVQQQVQQQRHEERAVQRQARREEDHGQGRGRRTE